MVTTIFTKKEAAKLLKVSPTTIDRLIVSGKLACTRIGGKRMFTENHLNEVIKKGEL
jgi:excisionase family DNA binding protein